MNKTKANALLLSSLLILIPYSLFGLALFFLGYLHIGLFTPYQVPDGFYVLAVFSMVLLNVGSAIISPIDLMIHVVADIQTPSGPMEVVSYGGGSYSIGNRGDAGIGIIILKFIVNVILTPFMLIYWIVIAFLILFNAGFAEKYIERIEEKGKVIASLIMAVGFILASIEFGCAKSREEKYSPSKFTFSASDLSLVYRHYYKDDFVSDGFEFEIKIMHPQIDELVKIGEYAEIYFKYDGKQLDDKTITCTWKPKYTTREPGKPFIWEKILSCSINNIYKETGHEGNGYVGSNYYNFEDYIKISEIDTSKLEIIFRFGWGVDFTNDKFSFIRFDKPELVVNHNW